MTIEQTTAAAKDIERKEATVLELAERLSFGINTKVRYELLADRPGVFALLVEEGGVVAFQVGIDLTAAPMLGTMPALSLEDRGEIYGKRVLLVTMITSLACKVADRARSLHKLTTGEEAPALA